MRKSKKEHVTTTIDEADSALLDRPSTDEEGAVAVTTAPPEQPPVLTVDELAALLRLNRKSVLEAIARREIPGVRRIGRVYRVSRDAVLDWLAEGQVRVSRKGKNP